MLGKGAQIDMVIDRADNVCNLCEMKFSTKAYAISRADDESLRHKAWRFAESQKTHKALHLTLVTPFGASDNIYRFSVDNVVTADDLFRE